MNISNNCANQSVAHVGERVEVEGDEMVEHHLQVIVRLLMSECVMQKRANVVAHGACEVVFVKRRRFDVGEISEEIIERSLSTKCRRQDVGVLESVPAEEGRERVVEALIDVVDCLAGTDVTDLKIYLLLTVLPVPGI